MKNIANPSDNGLTDDARWMALALEEAAKAAAAGEVPVGAVVVKDGKLLATGRNSPIATRDPSAHAEIHALRTAAAALGNYRLDGCTLYVTLEPCAMCAGAMLHARLARVVYGAADPRTGAAGSVVDLFGERKLNHHTEVSGGMAEETCAALLQNFFQRRRQCARAAAQPLRDDALRTPAARFDDWPDRAGQRLAVDELPALRGWRLSYLDTALPDGKPSQSPTPTVLCLHGWGHWSHLFRHLLPLLTGYRVLAPDLIGFGHSDKPKRGAVHSVDWHAQVLIEWVQALEVGKLLVVHHQDAKPLAEALQRSARLRVIYTVPIGAGSLADAATRAAWTAPFPDHGHAAGPRAFGQRLAAVQDDLDLHSARTLAEQIVPLLK